MFYLLRRHRYFLLCLGRYGLQLTLEQTSQLCYEAATETFVVSAIHVTITNDVHAVAK